MAASTSWEYMGYKSKQNALIMDLVPLVCVVCIINMNSTYHGTEFFLMRNHVINSGSSWPEICTFESSYLLYPRTGIDTWPVFCH